MTNRRNPPAFPASWTNPGDMNATAPDGEVVPAGFLHHMTGMTLRDYFAGQALAGLASTQSGQPNISLEDFARAAYAAADAMLAERSRS